MMADDVEESDEIDSGPVGTERGSWVEDRNNQFGLLGCGIDTSEAVLNAGELGVCRMGREDISKDLDDRDDDALLACSSRVSKNSIRFKRSCTPLRVIGELSTSVDSPELTEDGG